jgi:small subunit ribosomal protein S17
MARTLRGSVSSNKMDKTVVVTVARVKEHPIYRKKYTVTTKFKAHDADNKCKMGDVVEITESKPISRDKRWVVTQIIESKEQVA